MNRWEEHFEQLMNEGTEREVIVLSLGVEWGKSYPQGQGGTKDVKKEVEIEGG